MAEVEDEGTTLMVVVIAPTALPLVVDEIELSGIGDSVVSAAAGLASTDGEYGGSDIVTGSAVMVVT